MTSRARRGVMSCSAGRKPEAWTFASGCQLLMCVVGTDFAVNTVRSLLGPDERKRLRACSKGLRPRFRAAGLPRWSTIWATRMHGIAPCARVMAHAGDKALGMLQLRGEPTARAENMASSLATARFICLPRDSGFPG